MKTKTYGDRRTHQTLVDAAENAIDLVAADVSVDRERTRESLLELQYYIRTHLETLGF